MAGIVERVDTGRNLFTRQRLKTGQVVYRKNGKFTSARSYRSARASSFADVESTQLGRAVEFGRTPDTQWIRQGNRAGPLASDLLGEVREGQFLSEEQVRLLKQEMRFVHGFEAFRLERDDLTRDEAEDEFRRMIDKIKKMRSAAEREAVRIEFGLPGGSGFDARRAGKAA